MRPNPSSELTDSTLLSTLHVLASSRGRLRFHLPGWTNAARVEQLLGQLPGVIRVEANPLTGNILLLFDPNATNADALLDCVRELGLAPPPPPPVPQPTVVLLTEAPGRLRAHLADWSGRYAMRLEADLCLWPGVSWVKAGPFTRNVLILFNPVLTSADALLEQLRALRFARSTEVSPWPRKRERSARIAVRGLDRQPGLARKLIQHLERTHGVRARVKAVTGHLLVDYDHQRVLLEEVLAELTHLELPELLGEDKPRHPLDPEPLAEAVTRIVGTLLGMSVLTVRRLASGTGVSTAVAFTDHVAGMFNLIQGFPFVRDALRRLFGHYTADVVTCMAAVLALTFADSPIGLITTGVEALLLLSEVTARRAAWRRYEERLDGAATAEPGAMIRLEAGMRVPHPARVVEGMGCAVGHHGLPMMLSPGSLAPAGAVLSGGPFVLDLQAGENFEVEPRPAPPTPIMLYKYQRYIGQVS